MKALEGALSGLDDSAARDRVLLWACTKFGSSQLRAVVGPQGTPAPASGRPGKSESRAKGKPKSKPKTPITVVKDLNLKPQGNKSFREFAQEKNPGNLFEKCTVAVQYLRAVLGSEDVGAGHVLTCFRDIGWRVPSDLANTLQQTASRGGFLDTSDMSDIKVTARGENLVEYDLPRPTQK